MRTSLVVMGVAGCGKSSVGQAVAEALRWRLVEGDDFHSTANRDKMNQGIALTDADRAGWLSALADQLRNGPPTVLTCSALKRSYRDGLRAAAPGLRFVYLHIPRDVSLARVAGRESHFFAPSLVNSQFDALEDPRAEAGVLTLEATAPLATLAQAVVRWLEPALGESFVQP
jgi:gluconokinase